MKRVKVNSYSSADWPLVQEIIQQWQFKPLSQYCAQNSPELTKLWLGRIKTLLTNPECTAWIAHGGTGTTGFALLCRLPWDTNQLCIPVARLDFLISTGDYLNQCRIHSALLKAVCDFCNRESIGYLSARIDASEISALHALEGFGFVTLDGILTFGMKLKKKAPANSAAKVSIRPATQKDNNVLAELARSSYLFDRFHTDPVILKVLADELFASWVRNSCSGKVADSVIVAENGSGVVGFVTCKLQHDSKNYLGTTIGNIVLVATVKEAQGQGIARALTQASLDWFSRQEVDIVEVGTQLRNIPAVRLYESSGFRLVKSSLSLRRFWKKRS
ncbi:MAG: GNAT family N-acetyltransferase [Verrucomicrobiota bacterium]